MQPVSPYPNAPTHKPGIWLAVLLISLPALTQAGIIISEATPTLESHSASYNGPKEGTYEHEARIRDDGAPNIPVDFSVLGDTMLTMSIAAPTGQRFRFDFSVAGELRVAYNSGYLSYTTGQFFDSTPIISLTGFGGSILPTPLQSSVSVSGPGASSSLINMLGVWNIAGGSDFWFERIAFSTLVPASFATTLVPSAFSQAYVRGNITHALPNLGQFVRLESIPATPTNNVSTPASWLLLGLGSLVLVRIRRLSAT